MNFLKTTAATAVALTMIGSAASAATWTFGADAEQFQTDQEFEGTFSQVYEQTDGNNTLLGANTQDGITVTAWAGIHPPNDDQLSADPFMDALSGSKPAGLGVCSTGFDTTGTDGDSGAYGGISRCSTQYTGSPSDSGDDNLVFPEVLALSFSTSVWLQDLQIRDATHNLMDGFISILTDLTDHDEELALFEVINGAVQGLEALEFASLFYFSSDPNWEPNADGIDNQIYIETLTANIPLPAAGWLLIGGLGGLAAMKRRKKA